MKFKLMPLKKSTTKKAFVSNLKAELASGKKPKQALAIAFSVKRQAEPRKLGEKGNPIPKPKPKAKK